MTMPPMGPGFQPLPPGVYGAPGSDGYGHDTLLSNRPVETGEAFALQNNKMLKVTLGPETGMGECFARSGSMIAYQGGVTFDGNAMSWGAHVMGQLTGATLPLMKMAGQGTVFLANQAQDVHILALDGESFTVDKDNLLAFSPGLQWGIVRVDSQQNIGGMGAPPPPPGGGGGLRDIMAAIQAAAAGGGAAGNYNIDLAGYGHFAVCTTGPPLVMKVTPASYCFADADAVIGWSSQLQVQMLAATTTAGVWKPRGNTGESWQMQFSGEGFVVVQPSELMPPYEAIAGLGLGGAGTAFRGNTFGQ